MMLLPCSFSDQLTRAQFCFSAGCLHMSEFVWGPYPDAGVPPFQPQVTATVRGFQEERRGKRRYLYRVAVSPEAFLGAHPYCSGFGLSLLSVVVIRGDDRQQAQQSTITVGKGAYSPNSHVD